jgi:hypothetical protein
MSEESAWRGRVPNLSTGEPEAVGLNVKDVQNKSKVFAEILKAYNSTLKWDKWTEANFFFRGPPDGWVISVDQTMDVQVELKYLGGKHYQVWLKTKSPAPRGIDAQADVGDLKMTSEGESYFASPESVKKTWAALTDDEAKIVRELWDMAWGELQITYKDVLVDDVRKYFAEKINVYDTLDASKSVKVTISDDQFSHLVHIQRILLMMRSFYTGGQKPICSTVWSRIVSRMKHNEADAEKMAKAFNNTYAPDELMHYLQYVTETDQIRGSIKPYVIPGEEEGTFTLQVWHR